ncbi:MAG: T9SS type A sorting domain-containing protein [Bacteroidia bacterium]|nr:T9SS type A sorting domain-containing protein [Bacteroidia bacterium]
MKKILRITTAALSIMSATIQAQTTDTVTTGAGYANEVWYSLQNDNQAIAPRNNWDLAFETTGQTASILFNSATGNTVYAVPGKTPADFSTTDTSGISTWSALYNSDTTWTIGALNKNASNQYDLGWGTYNSVTHIVDGSKVFIIKYTGGIYKKFYIQSLNSGVYTLIFSDLDNSNQQTVTITKSTYNTKNFVYYSLVNNQLIDREPVSASWDLLFTKYTAFIPSAYGVTGILQNKGVTVAQANNVSPSAVNWNTYTMETAMNTIGYDWKYFTGSMYTFVTDTIYFVKDKPGNIYKIAFTGFGGSSNGNFIFTKEKLSSTGIKDNDSDVNFSFALFPNPSSNINGVDILFATDKFSKDGIITLSDINGRAIITENVIAGEQLQKFHIATNNLNSGIYIVAFSVNGKTLHKKLIIE